MPSNKFLQKAKERARSSKSRLPDQGGGSARINAGVFNTEQSNWQDRAIAAINPGPITSSDEDDSDRPGIEPTEIRPRVFTH
jgi:hypothetical protein